MCVHKPTCLTTAVGADRQVPSPREYEVVGESVDYNAGGRL